MASYKRIRIVVQRLFKIFLWLQIACLVVMVFLLYWDLRLEHYRTLWMSPLMYWLVGFIELLFLVMLHLYFIRRIIRARNIHFLFQKILLFTRAYTVFITALGSMSMANFVLSWYLQERYLLVGGGIVFFLYTRHAFSPTYLQRVLLLRKEEAEVFWNDKRC